MRAAHVPRLRAGQLDPDYEKKGQDYPVSYVRWTENRNMAEFLRLVSTGAVNLKPLITHQFDIDDAATAYQTILDPAARSLAVILNTLWPRRRLNLRRSHRGGGLKSPPSHMAPVACASRSSARAISPDGCICRLSRRLAASSFARCVR